MSRKTKTLPDQDKRDLIANGLDRCVLVEAAAGTGKTTSMIERMTALIRTGKCKDVDKMAAVTFTRKAAAELKSKFRIKLEAEAREAGGEERQRLERALADIDRCFIGTIHSFCARLLRERPVEAGIDLSFKEIDEAEDTRVRKEAWNEFVAQVLADDKEGVLDSLSRAGLSIRQLEHSFNKFADFPDVSEWPVKLEQEKTTIPARTVNLIQEYAEYMRGVRDRLPDECGSDDLIPLYKRIPRVVSHYPDLSDPSQCLDVMQNFMKKAKPTKIYWEKGGFSKEQKDNEEERWLRFQKEVAVPVIHGIQESRYGPAMEVLLKAKDIYDRLRLERGQLNFQDLLMYAAKLLCDKPHIRRYFARRFTHLLVDEFQDTDPVQAEVMLLLTASDPEESDWQRCIPRPGSLFVVGDPKQSIYRFRRADIKTYNQVKGIISRAGGEVVRLSANFRATGRLIQWVNDVFQPGEPAGDDKGAVLRFPEQSSEFSPDYVPLQQGREEAAAGQLCGVYKLTIPSECSNKEMIQAYEPDRIARTIRHALDTGMRVPRSQREIEQGASPEAGPSDFMILTRKRQSLHVFAEKIEEYGIPCQVTGSSSLNQVEELRLLHLLLHALLHPEDPVALVAALRSELFGVSDQALYEYKKKGGAFSYRAAVPKGLQKRHAHEFDDAYSRFVKYSQWFRSMPAAAAIEKTAEDIGLMALAGSRDRGEVIAGGMAKAIELLRSARAGMWSASQLVDYLGALVEEEEKYDGISVRSEQRAAVRVMNLHKAKGLEAPVVFLADPYGESRHDVEIHVDRSGHSVKGYLPIAVKAGFGRPDYLALPPDWNNHEKLEREFLAAEDLRQRYVAATRAGAALVITQREKRDNENPWKYFKEHLAEAPEMPEPGEVQAPGVKEEEITAEEVDRAYKDISDRRERAMEPFCHTMSAREYALSVQEQGTSVRVESSGGQAAAGEQEQGEHGVEWGSVIHALLEVAMQDPKAELHEVAKAALEEHGMDASPAGDAVDMCKSVIKSRLWERARNSSHILTEVPFQVMVDHGRENILVRGVIDLVFREEQGWVLVDYKTDRLEGRGPEAVAKTYAPQVKFYRQAFEQITGEKVKECGIYFVREDALVVIDI